MTIVELIVNLAVGGGILYVLTNDTARKIAAFCVGVYLLLVVVAFFVQGHTPPSVRANNPF